MCGHDGQATGLAVGRRDPAERGPLGEAMEAQGQIRREQGQVGVEERAPQQGVVHVVRGGRSRPAAQTADRLLQIVAVPLRHLDQLPIALARDVRLCERHPRLQGCRPSG
jgi:hypothetical protein